MQETQMDNGQRVAAFKAALLSLPISWSPTSPVKVDWFQPPPPETLPLLLFAVNPTNTMVLKVAVISSFDDVEELYCSLAIFNRDGSFMIDTDCGLEYFAVMLGEIEKIIDEKWLIQVRLVSGKWSESSVGARRNSRKYTYGRSWLGTRDFGAAL
jgi:hypothetical protein